MTEVAFHFNLADKLAYSCRLLRKMSGRGARAVVLSDAEVMARLDQMLWTFSAADFLPHCRGDAAADLLASSPVVLAEKLSGLGPALDPSSIVVNLSSQVPAGFEKYERLIELVGQDDVDRAGARQRWKFYADRGYAIKRHDLAARSSDDAA